MKKLIIVITIIGMFTALPFSSFAGKSSAKAKATPTPPPNAGNVVANKISSTGVTYISVSTVDGRSKTYTVTHDTKVTLDGRPATMGDLGTSMTADITVDKDGRIATNIAAKSITKKPAAKAGKKKK